MGETIYGLLQLLASQQGFLAVILVTVGVLFGGYFKFKSSSLARKKTPPGSLGFPLIGETIGFLKAQKKDKTWEWIQDRLRKHGPTFKTSLMGCPTVVLSGQAGNRFVFSSNDVRSNQILTTGSILGKHSIFEVDGNKHKLIRNAMLTFLKPESLQRSFGEMDTVVKHQLLQELEGKDSVKAVQLIKRISFNITCSLLFALPDVKETGLLFEEFSHALKGMWALPINLSMTAFGRAMEARRRICAYFSMHIKRMKKEMEEGKVRARDNVVSCFLNLKDEDGNNFSEEVIIDNLITMMVASHDTSSIVLSLVLRFLARDNAVCELVYQEQKKILMEGSGKLRWSDMQKMKYTWRVAQEVMRLIPPVFGNFRKTIADTTFGGFDIPKGWQVFWVSSITHMDKNIFEDPEKFDPSRFDNSSKLYPPYTYIPFGAGPRICPGMEFARMEMLLIIHHLITNYKWSEMVPKEPIVRDPMPYPAMGLPIKLHPIKSL